MSYEDGSCVGFFKSASVSQPSSAVILLHRLPATAEVEMPVTEKIDLRSSPLVEVWGFAVAFAVVVLYTLFW